MCAPSVVVHDFHILRTRGRPAEADVELIVDADTVLPGSIAFERFEPVARWDPQVIQTASDLQLSQFASGDGLDAHESLDALTAGERLRVAAPERDDHGETVTRCVINVKRDTPPGTRVGSFTAVRRCA